MNTWLRTALSVAAALLMLAGAIPPSAASVASDEQSAGCDPSRGGCPLTFGQPASAALADSNSTHLWWVEVSSAGRFHIVFFDPSASYRLSIWGPGGSEVGSSEPGPTTNTVDIVAAETGLYVLSLTASAVGPDPAPYLIVAVWDAADSGAMSNAARPLLPPVATSAERAEVAPARIPGPASLGRAPAAPSRLRAALTDSGDVRLEWRDNSEDETGFRIASSDESDPVTVEANRVVQRVQAAAGSSTCFRVQAFNDYASSAWSPEACVAVPLAGLAAPSFPPVVLPAAPSLLSFPPNSPRGLRVRPINHNTIQLDWTDTSDNETGFQIDGTGGFFILPRNATTTKVGGLIPSTSYCFRVFAVNEVGQSGTNEACATTPPPPPFVLP